MGFLKTILGISLNNQIKDSQTSQRRGYEINRQQQVNELERKTGAKSAKSWGTVNDEKVSAECMANQQAGWISNDSKFPSGDQLAPRKGNKKCRCHAVWKLLEPG